MTDERVVRSRLMMLPPIRRARLWRLYAEIRTEGRPARYLDMWMDGGRALLGAKGSGIGTAAKAAIDMGLLRPLPSIWERRLDRELRRAYPGYESARYFLDEGRALGAASRALAAASRATGAASSGTGTPARLYDAARREAPGEGAACTGLAAAGGADGAVELIRPFADRLPGRPGGESGIAMPLVPCPAAVAPSILLFKSAQAASRVEGDLIPPLRLAAAHRALCELARMPEWYAEELWRKVDRRLGARFDRLGPYLYPRKGTEGYGALFEAALSAGALLSPDPELPSMVPGDFDDGELAALSDALAAI